MKKNIILSNIIPATTLGIDLSDRTFQFCELNAAGEIVDEGPRKLDRSTLSKFLATKAPGARVAFETGSHSSWVRDLVQQMGHHAVVANARELQAVTGRSNRTDHHDARQLARLARVDPALLNPVELRGTSEQADLFVIRARAVLVEARTMLINFARGITKTLGHRLPASVSHCFAERARAAVPEALQPALLPIFEVLEKVTAQIEDYDRQLETLAEQYPQTRWLKQVPGVGTLTALTFVLTVGEPARFAHSRDVGPFLGLVPRRRQSGECDPHLRITKCGDRYLRRLLVQCAHVMIGRFGGDCALRQWALQHAQHSRTAKKRTVVAVARKLAVLLHHLWHRQEVFQPFPAAAAA